jgi:hypothetical protein
VRGLLFYLAEGNDSDITLNGNADSVLRGTIYAPDGTITVNGNFSGQGQLNTQLVAWRIRNNGNPDLLLEYDAADNYGDYSFTLDMLE